MTDKKAKIEIRKLPDAHPVKIQGAGAKGLIVNNRKVPVWFRTLAFGVAFMVAPGSAQAIGLNFSNFDTTLSYNGTNLAVPSNAADRTETGTVIGGALSYSIDSGDLTGGTGGRVYSGRGQGSIVGNFSNSGFDFDLLVSATAECVLNPTLGTCPPSVSVDGGLDFELTTDTDTSLTISGDWAGSDGGGLSTVDFFSVQLLRETGNPFNPEELIDVSTNHSSNTSDTGTIGLTLTLLAGERYFFNLRNKTKASASNNNLLVQDFGSANFTASVSPSVSPVPIPAALPLFGTGLTVMGLIGWRRKRKPAAVA
ncbi:MAG: hypothetical protein GY742_01580 [Hyphomicrobiales bacterium]|nr:hypothetical protein [Hyphomicrobiales bacterium]